MPLRQTKPLVDQQGTRVSAAAAVTTLAIPVSTAEPATSPFCSPPSTGICSCKGKESGVQWFCFQSSQQFADLRAHLQNFLGSCPSVASKSTDWFLPSPNLVLPTKRVEVFQICENKSQRENRDFINIPRHKCSLPHSLPKCGEGTVQMP